MADRHGLVERPHEANRAHWLRWAGTAVPADAWEAERFGQVLALPVSWDKDGGPIFR